MTSKLSHLLQAEREKTFVNAGRIKLNDVLSKCNTLTARNDGVIEVHEFFTRQASYQIEQGETTRFGSITQRIHRGVLEQAGLTVFVPPKNSATNFVVLDTRQSKIEQLSAPSVWLVRCASSPTFANSVDGTRDRMVDLRFSNHQVNGIALGDIKDVIPLVGSLHCDHISNRSVDGQQVSYRFGRHFAEAFGINVDLSLYDLDTVFRQLDMFNRDHTSVLGITTNHATRKQELAKHVGAKLTRELLKADGRFNGVRIVDHGDEINFNALDDARMTEKVSETATTKLRLVA